MNKTFLYFWSLRETDDGPEPEVPKDTGVRLNTVINIIDSVSEDMVFYKEKVSSI